MAPFANALRNLILVQQPGKLDNNDLLLIGDLVAKYAPDIHVSVAPVHMRSQDIPASHWQRPTVTVSFGSTGVFLPPRGPIFANKQIAKTEQYRRMKENGVLSPLTCEFRFGMAIDQNVWGLVVILKPASLKNTSGGAGLHLFRSARLAALRREDFSPDHFIRKSPMIMQRFINTGEKFSVYRCLTLFGEPLYQNVSMAPDPHPPIDCEDDVLEKLLPEPPRDRTVVKLTNDPEIMQFARDMAGAFPRMPVLGCDILREAGTGRLYGLEVNAGGNVWHLSSPRTARWRTIDKTISYIKMFDPYEKAARRLIDITREFAA